MINKLIIIINNKLILSEIMATALYPINSQRKHLYNKINVYICILFVKPGLLFMWTN